MPAAEDAAHGGRGLLRCRALGERTTARPAHAARIATPPVGDGQEHELHRPGRGRHVAPGTDSASREWRRPVLPSSRPQVLQLWARLGFIHELGRDHVFPSKRAAIADIFPRLDPGVCSCCTVRLYAEWQGLPPPRDAANSSTPSRAVGLETSTEPDAGLAALQRRTPATHQPAAQAALGPRKHPTR